MKTTRKLLFGVILLMMLIVLPMSLQASAATEGYYTYEITNGEATITDVDEAISGDIVIPSELGGCPVTIIGEYSFSGCSNITSITIPNNVISIETEAFFGCDNIKNVKMGNTVTNIGMSAFYNCYNLESIDIPDSVVSIGQQAFEQCMGATTLTIGKGLKDLELLAFMTCINLQNIKVDEDNPYFSSDEEGVLFNKDKTELVLYTVGHQRTKYVIPDSVKKINEASFLYCTYLTDVIIPESVTDIKIQAFYYCPELKSVAIPQSVTNIEYGAFAECEKINDIYYGGATEEEWNKVAIGGYNEYFVSATVHYNHYSNHKPTDEATLVIKGTAATCTQTGVSDSYACEHCGYVITAGKEIPMTDHIDSDDEDTLCDTCGKEMSEREEFDFWKWLIGIVKFVFSWFIDQIS